MSSQGQVLLNCTGPYRFLGEPVVCSCLEAGTDYVDLCGKTRKEHLAIFPPPPPTP